MTIGTAIIVGSILLADKCSRIEHAARHSRYEKCLATGKRPIDCSFIAAFKGDVK